MPRAWQQDGDEHTPTVENREALRSHAEATDLPRWRH